MGLFRSRKNKSSGEPSTVSLENHEHANELMSKNETLAVAREASVDKDAVSKLEGDADAVTPEAEDESKYPAGPKLWLLVLGLCLAIWVIALDNSSKLSPSMATARIVLVPNHKRDTIARWNIC
jgi:hypothetical protein